MDLKDLKERILREFQFSFEVPQDADLEWYEDLGWELYSFYFEGVADMLPALMIRNIDDYLSKKEGFCKHLCGTVHYLGSDGESTRETLRQFSLPQLLIIQEWQNFFARVDLEALGEDLVLEYTRMLEAVVKEKMRSETS